MLIRPCKTRCDSWACPCCGRRLGEKLAERLAKRLAFYTTVKGMAAFVLTLTFDRNKAHGLFECPVRLWKYCEDNRPVARAMAEFREAWGCDPVYFAKKELHKSGHVHFHCVLFIPKKVAASEPFPLNRNRYPYFGQWRHGFSKVKAVWNNSTAVSYLAKYVSKPVGVESDVLDCIAATGKGSARWTQCSKGFWGEAQPRVPMGGDDDHRGGRGSGAPEWVTEDAVAVDVTREAGALDAPVTRPRSAPVSLRVRLESCGGGTRVLAVELPHNLRDTHRADVDDDGGPCFVEESPSANRLYYRDLGCLRLPVVLVEEFLEGWGGVRCPDGYWEMAAGTLAELLEELRFFHSGGCRRALDDLEGARRVEVQDESGARAA